MACTEHGTHHHACACREEKFARLTAENARLAAIVEEFQDASGLCVPSEERMGDPGGVQPRHLAKRVVEDAVALDQARADVDALKAELEEVLKAEAESWYEADPDDSVKKGDPCQCAMCHRLRAVLARIAERTAKEGT